jgi:L-2-hydroxyglutarate oxidase LhgO
MSEHCDIECIVIGAGVIGIAIARAVALSGHEVIVLEAADGIGTETSSRNSEVIHAGIYYPTNSLKARFCVDGKGALYDYCRSHRLPFARCGKVIVATNTPQLATLQALAAKAKANGVDDLVPLDRQAHNCRAVNARRRKNSGPVAPSRRFSNSKHEPKRPLAHPSASVFNFVAWPPDKKASAWSNLSRRTKKGALPP